MPQLIKNIKAEFLPSYDGNTRVFSTITGSAQFEDYINLDSFKAYLQNFKQVDVVENLQTPLTFGLNNQYNLETITLQITY